MHGMKENGKKRKMFFKTPKSPDLQIYSKPPDSQTSKRLLAKRFDQGAVLPVPSKLGPLCLK